MVNIMGKKIDLLVVQHCEEECDVDIIMPSFKERRMAVLGARSFFKFEKNLKLKVIFVDHSGKKDPFDVGNDRITTLIIPDKKFRVSKNSGEMSHNNAYSLEVGRKFCTAPFVFVCHNDVLAYREGWLSYLNEKMSKYRLAAFLRDNTRIKAAHVSGFMYDRKFFDKTSASFWPQDRPERDVGDDFTYYLQKRGKPYFICPCSHNFPSLLKKIHKRDKKLADITADKCLDDQGNVIYLHTGRGTVKMMGSYKKKNRTSYKGWINFAKGILG